jgi:hypothetical protein
VEQTNNLKWKGDGQQQARKRSDYLFYPFIVLPFYPPGGGYVSQVIDIGQSKQGKAVRPVGREREKW